MKKMSSEIEALRAEFKKLVDEVKRASSGADGGKSSAAVGHADGENPGQLKMDLKELENMVLRHEAQLNQNKGSGS